MTAARTAEFLALLVGAYLVGAVPFGVLIGRWFHGVDVREHGSRNIGTTNVFRVLGTRAGVAVLACDMLKGFVPAWLAAHWFSPWPAIFIAAAPVVGHLYPVYLRFRGGKGVATGAAVVLALVPAAFAIILAVWLTLIALTRYVSVASLAASALVPVLVIAFGHPLPYRIAAVLVAVVVWWAHRGNIRRLREGTEHRVRLPWDRGSRLSATGGRP